jgi:glutaredoxin
MLKVKIFSKSGCGMCSPAKELGLLLEERGLWVEYFDIGTTEGLAEATFYGVKDIPAVLVEDDERVVGKWEGRILSFEELKSLYGF